MPSEPWAWNDPARGSEPARGYADWFAPPNAPDGLQWLRPGRVALQNLNLERFDPDTDVPTTLGDAILAVLRILAEDSGDLLIPFAGGFETAQSMAGLVGQPFDNDSEAPPFEYDGLMVLGSKNPILHDARDYTGRAAMFGSLDRIVSVIDVDIGFVNTRFRRPGGVNTRFSWFWDMDAGGWALPPLFEDAGGGPGLPYAFGRFLYGSEIDHYIERLTEGAYSEWDLYRDYAAESSAQPATALLPSVYAHGSHVLDIAQGGPDVDGATGLFGIQLPRRPVAQNDGTSIGAHLDLALLLTVAQRLLIWGAQGTMPDLQVNISVGGHSGRHDGASPSEQFMEALLQDRPVIGRLINAIYLPSGNSRESRTHRRFASGAITPDPAPVIWRIRPDDGTPNFLEIWLPEAAPGTVPINDPIRLRITTPSGLTTAFFDFGDLPNGSVYELQDAQGDVLGRLYVDDMQGYEKLSPTGPLRRRILIAITHTRPSADETLVGMGAGAIEATGDWQLEIQVKGQTAIAPVDLWIARDVEILRLKSGAKQSIFPDVFLPGSGPAQAVSMPGTINDLACGASTCVVGAHFASTDEMTDYSSMGFLQNPPTYVRDFLPSASAMAEDSHAHRGILAAGFFSGSTWRQGGTSVSSPLAMRYILDEKTPKLGQSVKDALLGTAAAEEVGKGHLPTIGPPSLSFGAGRLDATLAPLGYPERRRPSP